MPDTGPTSERLEALRARWEADQGSRVFLQLADEYRRLGRAEDAVRVLQEGLAENPRHPAALVALGRSQLELGRTAEAVEALERVVESDPTQMVAYRLLVEAYVNQGKPEEARERLRVYSLLNDADPEIAELRRRIGEIERRSGVGAPAQTSEGAAVPRESPFLEDDETAPETASPPEPSEAAAATLGEAGSAEEGPAAAPAASWEAPPPASPRTSDGEPFPDLVEPGSRRRYVETLAREGLFDLPEEPTEPEPALSAGAQVGGHRAGWDAGGEPFDLEAPRATPGPDLSSLLEPDARASEVGASEASPAGAPAAAGRPTVTLGRLYLRQGHRQEAEAIFREVLEREPDNREAHRHLEELAAEREGEVAEPAGPAAPLTAADLLAGWREAPGEGGMTERKRTVLERYLDRLRGGSPGDVH